MAAPPMDLLLYEQWLRDEVIYLHSLWHQGPPRAATSTSARHLHHLQPSQATQFKKEKKQKGKKSTNKPNNTATESHSSPGLEWAVPSPPPPPPTDRWPSLEENPATKPQTLSPEEQSRLAAKHAHRHALKVVTGFFRYNIAGDDSDSIDSSGDEDDDLMDEDDDLMDEDGGREEYSFFFKVFNEDNELREYYEKNFVKGEFICLVCGALGGKKMGKKYKGCFPLVQHSITIAKTKKTRAHRAFGQAVCKVLGWDINQLSSIVSLLSDKSGATPEDGSGDKESSMAIVDSVVSMEGDVIEGKNVKGVLESGSMAIVENVVSMEDGVVEGKNDKAVPESGSMTIVENVASIEGDIVEGKNDEAVPESGSIGTGILPNGDGDMNSLTCTDADKSSEDVGMVHNVEEPAAEGFTNEIGGGDNKESSLANADNVLTEEGDTVEGKNDEEVPENGALGAGTIPNGDEGDMNSLMCTHADKSLEDLGMVHPHDVEEPAAAEGLTNNSLTCTDAYKISEDVGMVHYVEEPAAEGLTNEIGSGDNKESSLANADNVLTVEGDTVEGKNDEEVPENGALGAGTIPNGDEGDMNSLTCTDADKSLEDLGMVHPRDVQEPAGCSSRGFD